MEKTGELTVKRSPCCVCGRDSSIMHYNDPYCVPCYRKRTETPKTSRNQQVMDKFASEHKER